MEKLSHQMVAQWWHEVLGSDEPAQWLITTKRWFLHVGLTHAIEGMGRANKQLLSM